jgi:glutathione peroxidase-family protein
MKQLALIWFFAGLISFKFADSFYDLPLKDIDGNNMALSQYKGKKLMVLVLPNVVPGNLAEELNTILNKQENLIVIGVPSEDDGYTKSDKSALKSAFVQLSQRFILAESMKVKKGAGSSQSPLFGWLTHIAQNGYFDTDVSGAGHKFFINSEGRLYAVISPNTSLSSPVIEKIISR